MQKESSLKSTCEELVNYLQSRYPDWEGSKQLNRTASRLEKMYDELCWPSSKVEEEVRKQFSTFENGFDEMLVTGPFTVWTICPHHLLPCRFEVTIGYIPSGGKVLGLSKFIRIGEIMAKRPIMQEQYCMELASVFEKYMEPKGVAIYVVGYHDCMASRGVKQYSPVTSSVVRGCFEEPTTRAEFFSIANLSSHK